MPPSPAVFARTRPVGSSGSLSVASRPGFSPNKREPTNDESNMTAPRDHRQATINSNCDDENVKEERAATSSIDDDNENVKGEEATSSTDDDNENVNNGEEEATAIPSTDDDDDDEGDHRSLDPYSAYLEIMVYRLIEEVLAAADDDN